MKRFLLTNKILLGVLCIAIGMVPLLTMLNTFESGKAMLSKRFNNSGLKLLSIKLNGAAATYQDIKKLKEQMPEIKAMIPISVVTVPISSYKTRTNVELKAVGSDYWKYSGLEIIKGSFINKAHVEKNQSVVVLDDLTADKLFGTTNVTGRNINLSISGRDVEAVIVGVSKRMDISKDKLNQEQGLAYVPITYLDNNAESYTIDEVLLQVDTHIEEAKAMIQHYFDTVGISEAQTEISYVNQIGIIKHFYEANINMLLAAAILWFFAVMVGLTNIMLVEVEQSRKYYGLLKFYGNTEKQIRKQIFSKALYMGMAGSAFSITIGLISSFIICNVLNIPMFVSVHTFTLGILIPGVVCLTAAVYPSLRAAKLDMNKVIWQISN